MVEEDQIGMKVTVNTVVNDWVTHKVRYSTKGECWPLLYVTIRTAAVLITITVRFTTFKVNYLPNLSSTVTNLRITINQGKIIIMFIGIYRKLISFYG